MSSLIETVVPKNAKRGLHVVLPCHELEKILTWQVMKISFDGNMQEVLGDSGGSYGSTNPGDGINTAVGSPIIDEMPLVAGPRMWHLPYPGCTPPVASSPRPSLRLISLSLPTNPLSNSASSVLLHANPNTILPPTHISGYSLAIPSRPTALALFFLWFHPHSPPSMTKRGVV